MAIGPSRLEVACKGSPIISLKQRAIEMFQRLHFGGKGVIQKIPRRSLGKVLEPKRVSQVTERSPWEILRLQWYYKPLQASPAAKVLLARHGQIGCQHPKSM